MRPMGSWSPVEAMIISCEVGSVVKISMRCFVMQLRKRWRWSWLVTTTTLFPSTVIGSHYRNQQNSNDVLCSHFLDLAMTSGIYGKEATDAL